MHCCGRNISDNKVQLIPSSLILQVHTLYALPNALLSFPPASLFSPNSGRISRKLSAFCRAGSSTKRLLLEDEGFVNLWASVSESQRALYRKYMEDRCCIKYHRKSEDMNTLDVIEVVESMYCGVFDGHLGAAAADFMVEHMHSSLKHRQLFSPSLSEDERRAECVAAFVECDEACCDLLTERGRDDGCTALICCLVGCHLMVSHVGDSRAVLGKRGGVAIALTNDHKPDNPDELLRIKQLGGTVTTGGSLGVARVNGILAMSRAMGDVCLKRPIPYVSNNPDISFFSLSEEDEWLILATDGLWDVVSSESAVHHVQKCQTAEDASSKLLNLAKRRGTVDNTLVLVVKFQFC